MIYVLQINDLHVSSKPVRYICYGLGSCVGLFISDRVKGISGGAHIPLPGSGCEQAWRDAESMFDELLLKLQYLGADLTTLRAKMTGGAQLFEANNTIGRQNVAAVRQLLLRHKIHLVANDTGGSISRTVCFNSQTYEVKISTSEMKTYTI